MTVLTETPEETYSYIATDVETLLVKSGFVLHTSTPCYRSYTSTDLFVDVEVATEFPYVDVRVYLRDGMTKVGSTVYDGYHLATAENVAYFVNAH